MANSFVITAVIKLNNFSKLCFTYNFTMSVWLLQCGNCEQEFKVQLNLKYHMYYIHLMSKIKALNVFEMSFSFSLAFSPSSSLVLSLTFFVLSVLRSLSFVTTFVCFALEFVLTSPPLDQMFTARQLFYTDTDEALKLSDLSLVTSAHVTWRTFTLLTSK